MEGKFFRKKIKKSGHLKVFLLLLLFLKRVVTISVLVKLHTTRKAEKNSVSSLVTKADTKTKTKTTTKNILRYICDTCYFSELREQIFQHHLQFLSLLSSITGNAFRLPTVFILQKHQTYFVYFSYQHIILLLCISKRQ